MSCLMNVFDVCLVHRMSTALGVIVLICMCVLPNFMVSALQVEY